MALIDSDKPGILDIHLLQGSNKTVSLSFMDKDVLGALTPRDLSLYSMIKMDVKSSININEDPFIRWSLGAGLTISGDDSEILSFEFSQEFNQTQRTEWVYDVKFVKDSKASILLKGTITITLTTTK